MRKLLFWPYQVYAWLIFMPLVVVLTLLFSTLAVLLGTFVNHRVASRYGGSWYARTIGLITPIRVRMHGEHHIDKQRSYVVVCNHVSQYDIIAVYGWLDLDLKWVIKQELRKVPGIGIGCEKVGHVFVDRRNPERARRAIREAMSRLGNGVGLLFFPEGTRSADYRLLPFKKGAFRTAVEQGMPVLPVTVSGTREILPARTLALFPGTADVTVHAAIETEGLGMGDVDDVLQAARRAIASALPSDGAGPDAD